MMKAHILNPNAAYVRLLIDWGYSLSSKEEADLILFTGGADISPHLYGSRRGRYMSWTLEARDDLEQRVFRIYQSKIPMLGICRGAQFLNVMNGGSLYQHVVNHGQSHQVHTDDGQTFFVTSTHHQMMIPNRKAGKILAWANMLSPVHYTGDDVDTLDFIYDSKEPEVVYYPDTRCLCVQFHPEYRLFEEEEEYVHNLVKELLQ